MTGHLLDRLVCFVFGHAERVWHVGDRGGCWQCVYCLHEEPSTAVRVPGGRR